MPLFKTITEPDFRLGVWRTTEPAGELFAQLPSGRELEVQAAARFHSPGRIREFAAVRALLCKMEPAAGPVAYQPSGRPWLPLSGLHLSISHTRGYAAVMLSPRAGVGVDIERQSERAFRLRSRIVGPGERAESPCDVLLHWSAKETVFKMMDCEGVDFLQHLQVSGLWEAEPAGKPGQRGRFRVNVSHPACRRTAYDVNYWVHEDFVLTYSIEI